MTRDQFIARLRSGLAGMSPEAIDDIVSDYETHFAEGIASGRTEDQVADALGDPDRLAHPRIHHRDELCRGLCVDRVLVPKRRREAWTIEPGRTGDPVQRGPR